MKTQNNNNTQDNENINYYVYVYYTADNIPFYCGSGTGRRYSNTIARSKEFLDIYNQGGCYVDLVEEDLDKDFSLLLEDIYINTFGRKDLNKGTLVNRSNVGNKNRTFTEEHLNNLRTPKTRCGVIDTDTGIVYNTVKDAALSNGINVNTLTSKMNGNRTNNTSFIYDVVQ